MNITGEGLVVAAKIIPPSVRAAILYFITLALEMRCFLIVKYAGNLKARKQLEAKIMIFFVINISVLVCVGKY